MTDTRCGTVRQIGEHWSRCLLPAGHPITQSHDFGRRHATPPAGVRVLRCFCGRPVPKTSSCGCCCAEHEN